MEHLGQFIMNHWQLWLAFIGILFALFITELMAQKKKAQELTPQSAIGLINNDQALVVDLRDKETYKKGHIIDSINASAEDFEQDKMKQYKNKKLILVCARGLQSPAVAAKIQSLGFDAVVLSGGIASWQNADLPLVKGKN